MASAKQNLASRLDIQRYFSRSDISPYDGVSWTVGDIDIKDDQGKKLFVQKDSRYPEHFSQLARQIVASRYTYGEINTDERETDFQKINSRVAETYGKWSNLSGLFDERGAEIFRDEIAELTIQQNVVFNSPVWFNVGTERYESRKSGGKKQAYHILNGVAINVDPTQNHIYPQTSACFIQSVDDTMEDIMRLATSEAMLFKFGSGTGTDLSTLRSSREKLSGGGLPSGPLQYLRFYDRVAAIVKSGGKTRRAAKMNSIKDYHPDVREFIVAKRDEERKANALVEKGYTKRESADSVSFQNANLSIRVTDEFLNAVKNDKGWQTVPIHNKELKMPEYQAKDLMELIAECAWECGDPGLQYETTINDWHTCPNTDRINASNPCSEYMFADNTSCNLASANLRKFQHDDGSFDVEKFENALRFFTFAMDLNYDHSSFPTQPIAQNSYDYRTLGVGYANLGSLLMSEGLPYDSDEGRALAASITALMTGKVYETSSELAEKVGTFKHYDDNKEPMNKIMRKHRDALNDIDLNALPDKFKNIYERALNVWDNVIERGEKYGFRNAQATVLAPTGTIAFMMDCDTTGIEPDIALVKYKNLAEGGLLRIVNKTVPQALDKLGYSHDDKTQILQYMIGHEDMTDAPHLKTEHHDIVSELRNSPLDPNDFIKEITSLGYTEDQAKEINIFARGHETIEGAPHLREEHLSVFDCAFKPKNGERSIDWKGHVKMMAAAQPFLSGAISKTVNMPEDSTKEDIQGAYEMGWDLGLKALAIYRDNSKVWQAYDTGSSKLEQEAEFVPIRRKLPETRQSVTQKFNVAGHEGYIIAGMYPDSGQPGEVFINMSKEGSTIGGLVDALATSISIGLQHAVPLAAYTDKFQNQKFEPGGLVLEGKFNGDQGNGQINTATSIVDYFGQALPVIAAMGREIVRGNGELNSTLTLSGSELKKETNGDLTSIDPDASFCPRCSNPLTASGGGCEKHCRCGYQDFSGCGQ